MAALDVSSMKICDITQCSICLETYKEPKALPCIHTFCLQCLDKHCENKGQEVACPECRKVFTIPPGGNKDLPNNFFMLQLLQVNKSAGVAKSKDSKQHLCELCPDTESKISSTSYCIECEKHICDRCSVVHQKSISFISHQVVRKVMGAQEQATLAGSYCEQHPAELNRLYCNDCKMVACHVCFVNNHKKHDLSDVNDSAEKFREQMKDDVDNVAECALRKLQQIKILKTNTDIFMDKIATTASKISQKYDQLLSLIQSHKIELMDELKAFKDKILKEVETAKDEMERQFVIRESFKSYSQEMMNKGTACAISLAAYDLHARAEELVKSTDEPSGLKLSGVEITFKPSPSTTDCVKSFIGELILREAGTPKLDFPTLLENHTKPLSVLVTGKRISGITILGSEIFVVAQKSQVHVFKSESLALIRNLTISGSEDLEGLVSSSQHNCLYVVDFLQKIIYRYDLTNNVTTNWSVNGLCNRLSVTKCYNVLATLMDTNRIQEYTTHGKLIREISLDSSIHMPYHCVQLSTGNYVVCHFGTHQHRVCIVDQNGRIIQSYDGPPGADGECPSSPYCLAVDVHDNMLVADFASCRVQKFSPTLTYLGDIAMPGMQSRSLHFDELNHRLYIGAWTVTGCRIFVFDVKY